MAYIKYIKLKNLEELHILRFKRFSYKKWNGTGMITSDIPQDDYKASFEVYIDGDNKEENLVVDLTMAQLISIFKTQYGEHFMAKLLKSMIEQHPEMLQNRKYKVIRKISKDKNGEERASYYFNLPSTQTEKMEEKKEKSVKVEDIKFE